MCKAKTRAIKDPILYSNLVFLIGSVYVYSYGDILYALIALCNFIVSGIYHYHNETKFRAEDSIISKISITVFVFDMIALWHVNMLISMINLLSNLLPLIYCFLLCQTNRNGTYQYLHIGVHWFATLFGVTNHLIRYHFN